MTVKSLATKLAAVPEQAVDALPSFVGNPWRSRRSWTAAERSRRGGQGGEAP